MAEHIVPSLILLIIALLYFLFPPKNINSFYGYRTRSSRKSPAHWQKANRLASVVLLVLSVLLLLESLLFKVFAGTDTDAVWFNTLLLGIVILFFIVEIKLRKIQ